MVGAKREEIPPQQFEPQPVGAFIRTEFLLVQDKVVGDSSR
jgi:hypothetical protein